jgi:hypothetical protein
MSVAYGMQYAIEVYAIYLNQLAGEKVTIALIGATGGGAGLVILGGMIGLGDLVGIGRQDSDLKGNPRMHYWGNPVVESSPCF